MYAKSDTLSKLIKENAIYLIQHQDSVDIDVLFRTFCYFWLVVSWVGSEEHTKMLFQKESNIFALLKIAKKLNKREFIAGLLEEYNALDEHIRHVCLTQYEINKNWLWLAATTSDIGEQHYFLEKYKTVRNDIFNNRFSIVKSDYTYNVYTAARVEENLVCLLLNRPSLHFNLSFNAKEKGHRALAAHQTLIFFSKLKEDTLTVEDYTALVEKLINNIDIMGTVIFGQTISLFIYFNRTHELYCIFLQALYLIQQPIESQAPGFYDAAWRKQVNQHLVFCIMWLVHLGIVRGEKYEVLQELFNNAKEIYTGNYPYITENGVIHHEGKNERDERLENLEVDLYTNFNPTDLSKRLTNFRSGENLKAEAIRLMNPHNPEFSPATALDLLKNAIKTTHQNGDIYLEYIRAQILMEPYYSCTRDRYLLAQFYKLVEHTGFYWLSLAKMPQRFTHEFEILLTLETYIRKRISRHIFAYTYPQQPEMYTEFPPETFQSAVGPIKDVFKVRAELYPAQEEKKDNDWRVIARPSKQAGFFKTYKPTDHNQSCLGLIAQQINIGL